MTDKRVYVALDLRGNPIHSLEDPTLDQDAATKAYVDASTPTPGVFEFAAGASIVNDTKYNAWPVICRLANGNLLLAYTKADSHHSDNTGNAIGRLSSDSGATWGSEFTIYDHATKWTGPYGVSQTSTGRIFCTLWRDTFNSTPTGEAGLVYSDDNGSTWSAWVSLNAAWSQDRYSSGPVIELASGDLLVPIEGTDSGSIANRGSRTLRSTNGGTTWGSAVTVAAYGTRPYYETKLLVLDNGDILAMHRTTGLAGTHYMNKSTDGGLTWGSITSAFDGYGAPSCIQLSTGTVMVTTRRNADAATIVYTSTDRGATWLTPVLVDATMYEMEYACPVELADTPGHVLVVYGYQVTSAITNSDIYQAYGQETYVTGLQFQEEGVRVGLLGTSVSFVGALVTVTGAGRAKTVTVTATASPLTTKGDLFGRSSSADVRVAIGADGTFLRADSTASAGVAWSTLHVEPHVAYDGTVVLDPNGDPVMVLVA